ncbi:MAG: substrate-binding domain-containing protein [Clostridia bacterium]
MKKFKVLICIVTVVALLGCCTAFVGCKDKSMGTIAVLAKGESHAFWQAVKMGAEKAGKEFNYNITFKGPAGEEGSENIAKQKELFDNAIANQPKAVVFSAISTGYVERLQSLHANKIPVIHFDSGIKAEDLNALGDKNPVKALVATSNVSAAGVAAENFYKANKEKIAKATAGSFRIGVIQHDTTATGIDRSKGFTSKIEELAKADNVFSNISITIEPVLDTGDNSKYGEKAIAMYGQGFRNFYFTNEGVVTGAINALKGDSSVKFDETYIVGFDSGKVQIQAIKEGIIEGSVTQNPIAIGYEAVKQAVMAIEGKETKDISLAGLWYDKSNIDSEDIKPNLYE